MIIFDLIPVGGKDSNKLVAVRMFDSCMINEVIKFDVWKLYS